MLEASQETSEMEPWLYVNVDAGVVVVIVAADDDDVLLLVTLVTLHWSLLQNSPRRGYASIICNMMLFRLLLLGKSRRS